MFWRAMEARIAFGQPLQIGIQLLQYLVGELIPEKYNNLNFKISIKKFKKNVVKHT